MPKPKTMDLLDACRSPVRRQIMQLAEEAALTGKVLTARAAASALNRHLSATSYHIKELVEAGALEVVGGEQIRGSWQRHLLPSEAFQATMTDTVALDQIAEILDKRNGNARSPVERSLIELVRSTGRPVEA